jgi:hypothetical protein
MHLSIFLISPSQKSIFASMPTTTPDSTAMHLVTYRLGGGVFQHHLGETPDGGWVMFRAKKIHRINPFIHPPPHDNFLIPRDTYNLDPHLGMPHLLVEGGDMHTKEYL